VRVSLLALPVVLTLACGGPDGPGADAAEGGDALARDALSRDAGLAAPDSAVPDASGAADAAEAPDAWDASGADAGEPLSDGGAPDTGVIGPGDAGPAAPQISRFAAAPSALVGTGTTTLSFEVTGATSLSIDPAVGTVTGTSTTVTVSASTVFTLRAVGPGGATTATTAVVLRPGYYVSPGGLDTNPGTRGQPFKTLAHALRQASSGMSVVLLSGLFDRTNEGCPNCVNVRVTLPNGVELRGDRPRAATLEQITVEQISGTSTVADLALDGATLAATMANLGEIMFVQGVSFSNDAILSAAGQAAIVMRPGSLSGPYTTRARNFAFALGESTILIQGGEIDAGNLISPNFGTALFRIVQQARLGLQGVTIRNARGSAIMASGSGPTRPVQVSLQDSRFERVGSAGNCGAGGAIVLVGTTQLLLNNSAITDGGGAAICLRTTANATVALQNGAILSGNGGGITTEIAATAQLLLGVDHASINDNTGPGVDLYGSGRLVLDQGSVSRNGVGIQLHPGSLDRVFVRARGTNYLANGTFGLAVLAGSSHPSLGFDFGTAADQGGNRFVGNTTAGIRLEVQDIVAVDASGNGWNPGVQGADASGFYTAGTVITGPAANGGNVQLVNGSVVRF